MKLWLLGGAALGLWGSAIWLGPDGCRYYWETDAPLIAHAGGGLPDKTYSNSLEALNLSYANGHSLIELDMQEIGEEIRFGHDKLSALTLPVLMNWLRSHPGVSIVTDFKTNNVRGLARLKREAPDLQGRFVPQIYRTEQYQAVMALGYQVPIFSVGRGTNSDWTEWVDNHPVRAVTVPLLEFWRDTRPPLYLHTSNVPIPGFGYYTDCLIPTRRVATRQ